jgi:hypothetical protein
MSKVRIKPKWVKEITLTIPSIVLEKVELQKVSEWGFGAGPSFCGGYIEKCIDPLPFKEALTRLSKYSSTFKRAHLRFEDGTIIYFNPKEFRSVVGVDGEKLSLGD